MEAYYCQHMSKPHQAAYHAMKVGFTALSPCFSVPRLDSSELSSIFFQLRLDCPEIFYVTGFSYRFAHGAENVELLPEYLFDKGKVKEHQRALSARVEKLVRPVRGMSDWEKERYIHDFICENVRYDKLKKPYSHEIIGPLGQGVGVCEGIAKSVKVLCDALGLWCVIAISEANPEAGVKYRHAWNILKLDGQYYHLDATFDGSLSHDGVVRRDYFNLDDSRLFRDHQPVLYPVPPCVKGDRFYYREEKLSFTKVEDVVKRAQMFVRKGLPFVFHWRGGYLTREVLAELAAALEEAAQKKNRHAAVSFNPAQAVVLVRFQTEAQQSGPAAEEANEGESYTEA
ncbi:transglutaminase domain-containing protein [Dysosmobacter sp. Sow4_B12]|uniref:transglutaminase domain-containing protein n=1 Tax=Dysosmobacter sp. Sow4_B12 TaxID=3438777 RepID=UPI003F911AC5